MYGKYESSLYRGECRYQSLVYLQVNGLCKRQKEDLKEEWALWSGAVV